MCAKRTQKMLSHAHFSVITPTSVSFYGNSNHWYGKWSTSSACLYLKVETVNKGLVEAQWKLEHGNWRKASLVWNKNCSLACQGGVVGQTPPPAYTLELLGHGCACQGHVAHGISRLHHSVGSLRDLHTEGQRPPPCDITYTCQLVAILSCP